MRKVMILCLILLASTCYAATVTIEVENDMEIVIKKKAVKSIIKAEFISYTSGHGKWIHTPHYENPRTTLENYGGW